MVSICLAVESLQEGLSGQGCTGPAGKHQHVRGMIGPISCNQFSHLSHVLLSGVYVLLQLSPAVKMWSSNYLTS